MTVIWPNKGVFCAMVSGISPVPGGRSMMSRSTCCQSSGVISDKSVLCKIGARHTRASLFLRAGAMERHVMGPMVIG